jgi:F420-dependent oxidoreductase-like protein
MRIGVFTFPKRIGEFVDEVRGYAERGLRSVWCAQIFAADSLTAIAVAGREVPDVSFGTAVVPVQPRHPHMLAGQALTVNDAIGGRLTLGIGLSHQPVVENMWGLPFERPATFMREYLEILCPLLADRNVSFSGQMLRTAATLDLPDVPAPDVLVAALGPVMLRHAGRLADGTVTWMVGPQTLAEHVGPSVAEAAADAGKPSPRVVVALPVAVTDDPDSARERAARLFQIYGHLPSYRAMLDREGAEGPADVAIAGDEDTVRAGIEDLFERGATEFVASAFMEPDRTLDLMAKLNSG